MDVASLLCIVHCLIFVHCSLPHFRLFSRCLRPSYPVHVSISTSHSRSKVIIFAQGLLYHVCVSTKCAVIGGSLSLLKWLVDEHCCPLRSIRVSSGRQKDTSGSYTPILTSKGRSLLTIALGNRNIGIVRYLVVEKRMLLWAEKDLSIETLVQNLDLVLRILPEDALGEQAYDEVRERDPTLGLLNSPSNNSLATSGVYDGINSAHLTATTEEDLSAIRASLEMNGDLGPSHDEVCISRLPANWPVNCL